MAYTWAGGIEKEVSGNDCDGCSSDGTRWNDHLEGGESMKKDETRWTGTDTAIFLYGMGTMFMIICTVNFILTIIG